MSAVEQSLLVSLLASLLLATVCSAVPWPARRLPTWLLAGGLVAGILASVLAVVLALPLYPWSNFVVLLVALTAGLLLARAASHPALIRRYDGGARSDHRSTRSSASAASANWTRPRISA